METHSFSSTSGKYWMVTLVAGLIGTVFLWHIFMQQENRFIRSEVAREAENILNTIVDELRLTLPAVQRMAQRWEASAGTTREIWELDAQQYVNDFLSGAALQRINANSRSQWSVVAKDYLSQDTLKIYEDHKFQDLLQEARIEKTPKLLAPVTLSSGQIGLVGISAIHVEDRFDGYIAMTLHADDWLRQMRGITLEEYFLTVTIDGEEFFSTMHDEVTSTESAPRLVTQRIQGASWNVEVLFRPSHLASKRSWIPTGVFVVGLVLSILLTVITQLIQKTVLTKHLKESRDSLKAEVIEREKVEHALRVSNLHLEQKTRELIQSNAELEQFAYLASHELQEPLRTISSFLQLLEQKYGSQLDKKAASYINFCVQASQRMSGLISGLLEYSRLGKQAPTIGEVDFNELIIEIRSVLLAQIVEKNASVSMDDLPALQVDRNQFTHLFQNLISNGIKFNSSSSPEVHISAAIKDRYWQFCVRDNGIGIEKRFSDKIFVIFKRLHPLGKYGGQGLGLALARRIVENHDGELWVDSEPGTGSRFYFTVPVRT